MRFPTRPCLALWTSPIASLVHPAAVALAIALFALGGSCALADPVPIGDFEYDSDYSDINRPPPITGIAGFNGTSFFTPGLTSPIDTLSFAISPDIDVTFTDVIFSIDSGFGEIRTYSN